MFIFCTVLRLPVPVATPMATVMLFFYNYMLARWAILSWRIGEGNGDVSLLSAADGEKE